MLTGGERLRPTTDATTVRVRDGEVLTSDGPFAETKEQMGGFYIVDCKDLDEAIEGEDVVLVEDIIDTGFTLRYLLQTLAGRAPNSLAVCTFLDRKSRRIVQVPVDYRCFEIDDRFVVGFGLDHNQLYRNLGYVAVMNPEKS